MDYEKDFEDGFEYTSMGALHYKYHPGTANKLIFLHGIGANTKVWGSSCSSCQIVLTYS